MPSLSNSSKSLARGPQQRNYLQEILLGLLPLLLGGQILLGLALLPRALRGDADFRQLYAAGHMLRAGHAHELYDHVAQMRHQADLFPDEPFLPFIRPAFQALVFVPLSVLRYRDAYLVFLATNLLMLVAIYRLLRPWLGNFALRWRWFPICFFFSFLPISIAVIQGQDTILLLAILAVVARLLDCNKNFLAGATLALGLFKLQIVVPIALLFLIWRRWRFFFGFFASSVVLASISVFVTGPAQAAQFLRLTLRVGASAALFEPSQALLRVNHMPNLRGLLYGLFHASLLDTYLQSLTIAGCAALFLFLVFRWRPAPRASDALRLAVLAVVVLSYYLLIHDLTIALLPLAMALNHSFRLTESSSLTERSEAWAALIAFIAPVYMLFGYEHMYLLSLPFLVLLFFTIPRRASSELSAASPTNGSSFVGSF